ncbi:hypothetical protein [Peribacillus butanolivorans]
MLKKTLLIYTAVRLDGLNLLYTLKKENNAWKVVKIEKKRPSTIGSEAVLEQAFLRAIGTEIFNATKTYYGETRLFDSERVVDFVQDEFDDK